MLPEAGAAEGFSLLYRKQAARVGSGYFVIKGVSEATLAASCSLGGFCINY